MISASRSPLEAAVKLALCTVMISRISRLSSIQTRTAAHPTPGHDPCMPRFDALKLAWYFRPLAGGAQRGEARLKRACLVGLALLISGGALAEEMKAPRISVASVDWNTA